MQKSQIKQNVNFLTNPTFTPGRKELVKDLKSPYGITLISKYRIPNAKDKQILISLLSLLEDEEQTRVVIKGARRLKRFLGLSHGLNTKEVKRLKDSLDAWSGLSLEADIHFNSSETGKRYDIEFLINGLISYYRIKRIKDKQGNITSVELTVRFNKEFLRQLRKPMFALTNTYSYCKLNPLAMRLYEMLIANLNRRKIHGWPIDVFQELIGKEFRDLNVMKVEINKALEEIKKVTGVTYYYDIQKRDGNKETKIIAFSTK